MEENPGTDGNTNPPNDGVASLGEYQSPSPVNKNADPFELADRQDPYFLSVGRNKQVIPFNRDLSAQLDGSGSKGGLSGSGMDTGRRVETMAEDEYGGGNRFSNLTVGLKTLNQQHAATKQAYLGKMQLKHQEDSWDLQNAL